MVKLNQPFYGSPESLGHLRLNSVMTIMKKSPVGNPGQGVCYLLYNCICPIGPFSVSCLQRMWILMHCWGCLGFVGFLWGFLFAWFWWFVCSLWFSSTNDISRYFYCQEYLVWYVLNCLGWLVTVLEVLTLSVLPNPYP